MVKFTTVSSEEELQEILDLQHINLLQYVEEEEKKDQGFVTIEHHFELLQSMGGKYPHIIAKAEGKVVGYALVELEEYSYDTPELIPMIEEVKRQSYEGIAIVDSRFFIMGQICIAKEYRGQGIFYGLYDKMKEVMRHDFDFIITEVDSRNTRSMRAHLKANWQNLLTYTTNNGKEWNMILLDLRKK